jgi:hypothetical protein
MGSVAGGAGLPPMGDHPGMAGTTGDLRIGCTAMWHMANCATVGGRAVSTMGIERCTLFGDDRRGTVTSGQDRQEDDQRHPEKAQTFHRLIFAPWEAAQSDGSSDKDRHRARASRPDAGYRAAHGN